ncbi:hypothetical protein BJP34_16365 [Moorena producens PAL-8-15-08-1]|uniref:Uncharacterized protein n=1 Tax=Moorena producens PAL-8-15-08-1 TaxID=1458985 RepID=A0A1D8TTK9_9CYAN|nr:hypothetical protein [Moorena producens]AOX00806.1 hypothetical protein BJP34_16365 [Moorena producens PAL-8-15-08-1]
MIQHLLSQISQQLQQELIQDISTPQIEIVAAPITESPTTLPHIAIYPGKWEIASTFRSTHPQQLNPEQQDTATSAIITTSREFNQEFFIDIYDADLTNLEKLASLTTGIILTNNKELIETYNLSTANNYQAKQTATTHSISQITILEGSYDYLNNTPKLKLKWQVIGQVNFSKTITEFVAPIEEIEINQTVSSKRSA